MPNPLVVVDVNIGGDILRVAVDDLPILRSTNPTDVLAELREDHDALRRFMIEPPYGHGDVNGAMLFPPHSSDAVRTFVVAAKFGFAPLAGTPLMAAAAALLQVEQVTPTSGSATLAFDTSVGLETVTAHVTGGVCHAAKWTTNAGRVAAFNQSVLMDDGRHVAVTIVHAGLPYALVRADDLGVALHDADTVGRSAAEISQLAGQHLPMRALGLAGLADAYPVLVVGKASTNASDKIVQMAWCYADGRIAKTPAGTGAVALAAWLQAHDDLDAGTRVTAVSPSSGSISVRLDGTSQSGFQTATVEAEVSVVATRSLI